MLSMRIEDGSVPLCNTDLEQVQRDPLLLGPGYMCHVNDRFVDKLLTKTADK